MYWWLQGGLAFDWVDGGEWREECRQRVWGELSLCLKDRGGQERPTGASHMTAQQGVGAGGQSQVVEGYWD